MGAVAPARSVRALAIAIATALLASMLVFFAPMPVSAASTATTAPAATLDGLPETLVQTVAAKAQDTAPSAARTATAVVSGRITFPDGVDVSYGATYVGAFLASDAGDPVAAVEVTDDGAYEFDVPVGDTVFVVVSEGRAVADEWWEDAPDFASADVYALPAEPTSIDFTLDAAGLIGGVVEFPDGIVPATGETYAIAFDESDPEERIFGIEIFEDGRFGIGGLESGQYALGFFSDGRAVHDQYWRGAFDLADAELITLADAEVRDDIVERLEASAAVSGKVTVPRGFDMSSGEVSVLVYPADGDGVRWAAGNYVAADGTYTVGGLFAGEYRVRFVVSVAGPFGEWWNNKPTFATASVLPLTAVQKKTGVNATLETKRLLVTATPKISGTAKVGQTLKATRGTWTGDTKFSYQWYANGRAISKATSSSLTLSTSVAGKKITVKVTGSRSGYITASQTSAATKTVVRVLKTAAPTISGTAHAGKALKAKAGTWTSGTRFSYQWYAGGNPIKGATSSTLKVSSSWGGKSITVKVTGSKSGYASSSRTSKATAKVLKKLTTATPTIAGSTKVGQTLSARASGWTSGTSVKYQWYANGKAIPKATSKTLKVSSALVGKRITVKVTGKKSGFVSASRTSKATSTVSYPTRAKPSSRTSCPSWAPIKGNESSMIYHLPNQRFYDRTHPEECFRTEGAAVAAGYRKSKV